MSQSYYEFREARSAEELRELFKLRYNVYRESRLAKLAPTNEHEMNIDCYDGRGIHYGFFRIDEPYAKPVAVGYARIVFDREMPAKADVWRVIAGIPEFESKLSQTPVNPLPIMSYFPDTKPLQEVYGNAVGKSKRVAEVTRLVLDPSVRGLSIARHLVSCIFAVGKSEGVDLAIVSVAPSQRAFYERFGFCRLEGTSDQFCPALDDDRSCLICSPRWLEGKYAERVETLLNEYRETGCICCTSSGVSMSECFALAA